MKLYKHPKTVDINNTYAMSSQIPSISEVCAKVKSNKGILIRTESNRISNDKELDQALKDTFPASDAIAKYL